MERHIILSHKLKKLHIFWILPPFLPFICVAWCNGDISYRCIKPDIEDLTKLKSILTNIYHRKLSGYYNKERLKRKLTLSLNLSSGTGTPHFRSLVIHRGFNPSLSQACVAWIAFWLQDPATDILLIYSSSFSLSKGSSRNMWFVSRIRGVVWQTYFPNINTKLPSWGEWNELIIFVFLIRNLEKSTE